MNIEEREAAFLQSREKLIVQIGKAIKIRDKSVLNQTNYLRELIQKLQRKTARTG